jgi:hypothetical protein
LHHASLQSSTASNCIDPLFSHEDKP